MEHQTRLANLCGDAKSFPLNFSKSDALAYVHEAKYKQLNDEGDRLFCDESKASLNFLDFGIGSKGKLLLQYPSTQRTAQDSKRVDRLLESLRTEP